MSIKITTKDIGGLINEATSMKEVLDYYGIIDTNGTISCPFHPDDNRSMKVYHDSDTFHCFACKASGSIVQFVRYKEGILTTNAINYIVERIMNKEFNKLMKTLDVKKGKLNKERFYKWLLDIRHNRPTKPLVFVGGQGIGKDVWLHEVLKKLFPERNYSRLSDIVSAGLNTIGTEEHILNGETVALTTNHNIDTFDYVIHLNNIDLDELSKIEFTEIFKRI
jgi:hypothetical protein